MTQQNNSRSTFVLIVLLLIKYICYYIKLKQNAFPTTTSGLDIGYVPAKHFLIPDWVAKIILQSFSVKFTLIFSQVCSFNHSTSAHVKVMHIDAKL